ncbi:MAG: hypothetical protein AYP45_10125 [Candidatus Brocadia carolinensis]|uniref:Phospholipase/carboxylesterase/thioesterase domain-containing protein n=1 Tax=Candidatus Brocadia carolinensis TaxID=1004156 RepID=A0A1V4AT35_9BACT|nr:MAG: hypothetical protein AYP45_10125 [Candidatus Brocadia caroliniensis]
MTVRSYLFSFQTILLAIAIMLRITFTRLSLFLLIPLSTSFGQDVDSMGRSLVNQYLVSTNGDERENIIKALDGLQFNFTQLKDWVNGSAHYTSQQPGLHRELVSVGDKKGEYFVYVPSSYRIDRAWPVVLALHGVGGSGYGQIMTWLKSSAHNDEFIFITPTYGSGLWWNEEAERLVLSVFDKVKQDYHIDTNRVYLTGFSSGGHGVWYFALRYPSLFAAINPIAAECLLPYFLVNLEHVPVYIIHGTRDSVIPVEAARDASSRLEKLNYTVVYKELSEQKHQFPVNEIAKVLDWFRMHKRTLYPKRIKFSTESTGYSFSYWIEITGFSELIGQVSGVSRDIAGRLVRPQGFSETATVVAEIKEEDNEVCLTTHEVNSVRLFLDEDLIDMERPLRVSINGKEVYCEKVRRSVQTTLDTVKKRNDQEALFSVCLDLCVPSD